MLRDIISIRNQIGGGVSESNQPKFALTNSQTVLKTAPITGQDAPPRKVKSVNKTNLANGELSSKTANKLRRPAVCSKRFSTINFYLKKLFSFERT